MQLRLPSLTPRIALLVIFLSAWCGACSCAEDNTAIVKAAAEAIDSRLVGKGPTAGYCNPEGSIVNPGSVNLWHIGNFNTGTGFVWSPGLWCIDWEPYFTCFSPYNSNEHMYQAGTLITLKHILFAEHFSGASGSNTLHAKDTIKFVTKSGATLTGVLKTTPERVGNTDLCIGTLEHDLPPGVIPAQVLPPGLPPDFLPPGTPVLFTNKNKEIRVAEVASFSHQSIMPARAPSRAPWTLPGPAAVGDSGCPVFVILNGRPVLWWLFHFSTGGDNLSVNVSVINKMLGKGYQLDVAKIDGQ